MASCVKFAFFPMTFAALLNAVLTLAFSAKPIFSLLLAFGSVLLAITFRIETDGHTFFGSALASRFHGPSK